MRALWALYVATIREFLRDATALFWMVGFPILFMLIIGVIYGGEGDVSFSVGLVNQDADASAELASAFEAIEAFDVHSAESLDSELDKLQSGDRDAVIAIPAGTGAALGRYFAGATQPPESVPLHVYTDPADQVTSQVVLSVIDRVIAGMSQGVTGNVPALVVESRSVTSDDFRYIDYLLPGVLALNLLQLGLYGTAEPLVSLREKAVLRRMGATPLSKTTLLASQVLFRMTIAVLTTLLIIAVGVLVFDVAVEAGNVLAITAVIMLGAALFITMGYVLAGIARTENAVQGIIALPYFVMMFLSGIFFPLDTMPDWIRPFVDALPLTYLGDALRKTMLEAGSYYSMAHNVVIMAGWLVACALLAVRLFKWEPQA